MLREPVQNIVGAEVRASTEKPRTSHPLRRVAQIALGLGALAFLIARSDSEALLEAMGRTRVAYLPLAVAAAVTVTWLMALRWGLMLRVRRRISLLSLFRYYLIGIFFSNFVPGGSVALDVTRLVYVDREIRDKPFVVSTLMYERIVGLFGVLVTGLLATLASHEHLPAARTVYAVEAILVVIFLLSASLVSGKVSSWLVRGLTRIGVRLGMLRLTGAGVRVLEAIAELRKHPGMIVATVLLSLVIRVVWSLGCYVVAWAMGLPVTAPLIFAFISIYDLIRMLPITVNGLGLREWALVALFANVGVAREEALMFSLLAFAPILINALIGGLIYIHEGTRRNTKMVEKEATKVLTQSLKRGE